MDHKIVLAALQITINYSCRHSAGGKNLLVAECMVCACEASLMEQECNQIQAQKLEEYLDQQGLKRIPVAGDGHCIIHSWKVGLENAGVPVSHAHHLLDAAIDEIVENINFYQDFVDGDMMEQLTEYRSLGMYQSEVVDMMLYALANATRISCDVLSVRDDRVQTISITPRGEQPNTTIKVFKLGAHYDGVAHVENSKEGRYQNNSALLHSVPIVGLAMPIQSVLSG